MPVGVQFCYPLIVYHGLCTTRVSDYISQPYGLLDFLPTPIDGEQSYSALLSWHKRRPCGRLALDENLPLAPLNLVLHNAAGPAGRVEDGGISGDHVQAVDLALALDGPLLVDPPRLLAQRGQLDRLLAQQLPSAPDAGALDDLDLQRPVRSRCTGHL